LLYPVHYTIGPKHTLPKYANFSDANNVNPGRVACYSHLNYHDKYKQNICLTSSFPEEPRNGSGNGTSWIIGLCKLFVPFSRQITMPAPQQYIFYRLDALPRSPNGII